MKIKIKILFTICMVFGAGFSQGTTEGLKIHLPREIEINRNVINLVDITILSGNEQITSKIKDVVLGRLAVPGQSIKIDRNVILSRLASNGIDKKFVEFSGAENVIVKLRAARIDKELIILKAEELLKKTFKGNDNIVWELASDIEDVIVEADISENDITVGFDKYGNSSRSRVVIVSVVENGNVIASEKLRFLLKYKVKQLIASSMISRGNEITEDVVREVQIITDNPFNSLNQNPFGKIAKRDIQPGQVIRRGSFGPKRPEKIVKRNQTVLIRLSSPGLILTVPGEALQDGFVNDLVKVRVKVTNEEKIIIARVLENGNLEPAL